MLNRPAFAAGARSSVLDDGVNLNRAFVAGAGQDPVTGGHHASHRRLRADRILPMVDVVIDLHAGGEVAGSL